MPSIKFSGGKSVYVLDATVSSFAIRLDMAFEGGNDAAEILRAVDEARQENRSNSRFQAKGYIRTLIQLARPKPQDNKPDRHCCKEGHAKCHPEP